MYATEKSLVGLNTLLTAGGGAGSSFVASTTGGLSVKFFANSGLLTNVVQAVKSSAAGTFWGFNGFFDNSTKAFLQMFDVATAGGVTIGTTVADYVLPIPPYWYDKVWSVPIQFTNGFQCALTTTATGLTAVTGTAFQGYALFK